jgi:chemotaxis protein MotB
MAKKVEEPKKEEAPEWIVSFTDMTSLEMAFFIVLMSFSTPRKEKLDELQGSIQGAFGFLGKSVLLESQTPPRPILQGRDLKNPNAPSEVPRFIPLENHEIRDDIMRLKDQSGQDVDIDRIAEGYRVRIGDSIRFAPGETEMTSASFPHLAKIAELMHDLPYRIVVIGYAGAEETAALGSEARAIDLALHRAVAIAERMARDDGIAPDRLAVASYRCDSPLQTQGRVEFILADEHHFRRPGAP